MTKRTALVTGASKGIGLEIARQLGQQDYRVWLGCRDRDRGDEAAAELEKEGIEAETLLLDVTDQISVDMAAEALGSQIEGLNALVNNAGMHKGYAGTVSNESVEDMRTIFDVNAFGAVRVTQAFLRLLRAADAARVVMMSSGLGSISSTPDPTSENWDVDFAGYGASKAALNMFVAKFARELMAEKIKVNAADPGLTATDLNGHMGPRTPEEGARIAVHLATLDNFGPTGGFFHETSANPRPPRHPW